MTYTVPFEGPLDAQIAFIGEAPGRNEIIPRSGYPNGRPFVGAAGTLLDTCMARAALIRPDCFMANVMQDRPPQDKFLHFWVEKRIDGISPTPELAAGIAHLKNEITRLHDLRVIVTLGRQPTYIMTGKDGITKWRGSVIPHMLDDGRIVKVIPTYHPSFLLHGAYNAWPWVVHDLQRAKIEAESTEIPQRISAYSIYPSDNEIREYIDYYWKRYKTEGPIPLACDIETYGGIIARISLSYLSGVAISIPFYDLDRDCRLPGRDWIWQLLKPLLETAPIIGQNFMYDSFWLWFKHGIDVAKNIWHDTKLAQHTLLPGTWKKMKPLSLQAICSMWTDPVVPYYKDEGAFTKTTRPTDKDYGTYSCKDADITRECALNQRKDPLFTKRIDTFNLEMDMIRGPIPDVMRRGVRFNAELQRELFERGSKECELLELLIAKEVGYHVNPRSPKQVAEMLYDDLKLPAPKSRTTNKDQLLILAAKYPNNDVVVMTANHRKTSKLCDNMLSPTRKVKSAYGQKEVNVIDEDGRVRCQYCPTGTKTGRCNSTTTPFNTGWNLHTVPRKDKHPRIRHMFEADPGHYFIHADLAQAELRVVAYMANALELIAKLEDPKTDIHTWMAQLILSTMRWCEVTEISYEERQLGKRNVHADNYLMGPDEKVRTCRVELGIDITRSQAKAIKKAYFNAFPEIPIWHQYVEFLLKSQKMTLKTPLGRERVFFDNWKDVLKTAVAFLPQSTIGDLLDIIWTKWWKEHTYGDALLQNHDALALQCREKDIKPCIEEIKRIFNYPFMIGKHEVVIPVDIEVSRVWEGEDITEEVLRCN
jgi:uracil-DNA glycosylase family 4